MPTEIEIKAKYKELHDLLSESYYNFHNISKGEFDLQHAKIWSDMEAELIAITPRQLPEPVRDPLAELDVLKAKVAALEKK